MCRYSEIRLVPSRACGVLRVSSCFCVLSLAPCRMTLLYRMRTRHGSALLDDVKPEEFPHLFALLERHSRPDRQSLSIYGLRDPRSPSATKQQAKHGRVHVAFEHGLSRGNFCWSSQVSNSYQLAVALGARGRDETVSLIDLLPRVVGRDFEMVPKAL